MLLVMDIEVALNHQNGALEEVFQLAEILPKLVSRLEETT